MQSVQSSTVPVPVPTPIQTVNAYPIACHKDGGTVYSNGTIINYCYPMKQNIQVGLDVITSVLLIGLAILALVYSIINFIFKK